MIPQAMAYATIADLPTEVGLYTCMVPMVVYALLGGSRTLSVSTTSTIAILTGSTLLAAGVAAGADDPARALATLTLLVGVILLVARLLRLGVAHRQHLRGDAHRDQGRRRAHRRRRPAAQAARHARRPDRRQLLRRAARPSFEHLDDISWITVAFSAGTLAVLLGLRRVRAQRPRPRWSP